MIWYRHWLELRWRLPVLGVVAALLGVWPAAGLWPGHPLLSRVDLGPQASAADVAVWGGYVWRLWALVFMAGITVSGNGFRAWYMDKVGPSDVWLPFTLSLPLSRVRLIWTRYASVAIVLLAAMLITLVVQITALRLEGRSVPATALLTSTAVWTGIMAAWVVIYGALLMVRSVVLGLLLAVPAILVCGPLALVVVSGVTTGGRVGWVGAAAFAAMGGLAFAFTVRRARKGDF